MTDPAKIAARDQAEARARDHVAHGGPVMFIDKADPGQPCCWCDCPDTVDSPHMQQPGYVCQDKCPDPAVVLLTLQAVPDRATTYLLCKRHQDGPIVQLAAYGFIGSIEYHAI